ncbi:hypothetical protein QQ045_024467 [Rhodiola kirilowii]
MQAFSVYGDSEATKLVIKPSIVRCVLKIGSAGVRFGSPIFNRLAATRFELWWLDNFQSNCRSTCEIVLTGKVVVTKKPCVHPGDVRVLDAVYEAVLEENGLVDYLVFPQNDKAKSSKCLELADLHSMAVDFAKTGAAAMPKALKPTEFPDFLERIDMPTYPSQGVLGKLYRATFASASQKSPNIVWGKDLAAEAYDHEHLLALHICSFLRILEF